jgi:hypothetical protein
MRKYRRSRFGLLAVLAIIAAFVAVPAVAVAQDSTSDPSSAQYDTPIPGGTEGASAAGQSSSGGGGGGLSSNIGSLPFTGMDLLIVAGVALVLTGTGFALRRLSMPPGPRV